MMTYYLAITILIVLPTAILWSTALTPPDRVARATWRQRRAWRRERLEIRRRP